MPFAWVAGDSVYGADSAIRRWAERHRRGYVMAVTSGQRLGRRPVTTWIEDLAADAWRRLRAGDGAKGPRLYDWAHLPFNGAAKGFACALLVRRSIAKPDQVAFFLTHAPQWTSLAEPVRVAGARWSIESLFEQGKGEVGLYHYEVRSLVGWHRHVTLAYLAVVRRSAEQGATGEADPASLIPDLLPLAVPEVRRLIAALALNRPPRPSHVLHRSTWRRHHQQRAKRAHWHTRTQKRSGETRLWY